jgi:predicted PolB exonuclease-like 3'-5' exonuclease
MEYIIIDLETVDNGQLPDLKPKEGTNFPPIAKHRIVALSAVQVVTPLTSYTPTVKVSELLTGVCANLHQEKEILSQFSALMSSKMADPPVIVTYSGRRFDFPVIVHRAMHHGIVLDWYFKGKYRSRYDGMLVDIPDILADYGAAGNFSNLDSVAKLTGLPGKVDYDGADVQRMFDEGRLEDILDYNVADTVQTAAIYFRLLYIQGRLELLKYQEIVATIMRWYKNRNQFSARMIELMNKSLLLLKDVKI